MIVGPTGSGKGTLLTHLRQVAPHVVFPVSCTTRPPRPGEVEGVTYYFISDEEFQARAAEGEFIEWVYTDGKRYGTLKSEIIPALEAGKTVTREVDIKGVRKIKESLTAYATKTLYVDAGPWEDLERRIVARAPLSAEEIASRKARFEEEILFKSEADAVVENLEGHVEEAKSAFIQAIQKLGGAIE